MASCPVLGTTMPKKDMIPYEYQGKTYYLCCQSCVDKFKANPEKYIQNPAKPLSAGAPTPRPPLTRPHRKIINARDKPNRELMVGISLLGAGGRARLAKCLPHRHPTLMRG